MKKYLSVLVLVAFVVSCNLSDKKKFAEINSIVQDAETIVKKQDNIVFSSIDSKKFDYIVPTSNSALDSLGLKVSYLSDLDVPDSELVLKTSAIEYVKSLQNFVRALKEYAQINDSISMPEAQKLDTRNKKAMDAAVAAYNNYKMALDEFK